MTLFAPIRTWFLARTSRERWLILLMLTIALPLLAWLLVARPLMLSMEAAKARHVLAVQNHGAVLAQLAQIEGAARPATSTGAAPLAIRVTDSAAQAGIRLAANEPRGPGAVAVAIAAAPPTDALRWLRQLEASGIAIRELTITPQGLGAVTVSATLGEGTSS